MVATKLTTNPNGKTQLIAFIPAYLEDNPIGMARDPQYEARLMARDETTAQALRFGMWSVFAGQMFRTFSKSIHVCPPFEIPLNWTRWTGTDWGFAAPFSHHCFAKDPDTRRTYVYREIYKAGLHDPEQAELIKDHWLPGETFIYHFADPSMWTRRTTDLISKSTYDVYLEHGVLLTKADNDQRSKVSKTRSSLANIHDKKPAVMIFDTCPNLIRILPAIMSDPKNPEIPLEDQEDHAWDDYAYGLTNWTPPQPPVAQQSRPPSPWTKRKHI